MGVGRAHLPIVVAADFSDNRQPDLVIVDYGIDVAGDTRATSKATAAWTRIELPPTSRDAARIF